MRARTAPAVACVLAAAFLTAGSEDESGSVDPAAARGGETVGAAPAAPPARPDATPRVQRWYGPEQVARGEAIYAEHCARCHGAEAQGAFAWRKPGPDGRYPAPPLDGSGHAWHHPVRGLAAQISGGTPGGGGSMPGFGNVLSDEQVLEVIAWLQDRWTDEVYAAWHDIEVRSRQARR